MTPWVTRLIVANVAMFAVTGLFPILPMRPLMLVPILVPLQPWTLITYMFLHAGMGHIFFNMLGLFFFGPRLESRLGGRQFLWLYFLSGLMGALLSVLTPFVAIVGASGAVFGVLFGFAYYWPRETILIWGIFPVEARWLVVAMTAFSLYAGMRGGGGVAHFAHLGGFVGAFLYLKWREHRSPARQFKVKAGAVRSQPTTGSKSDLRRWAAIRREDLHEVNRDELDRVLEKISASGGSSLTPDERAFLDRLSGG